MNINTTILGLLGVVGFCALGADDVGGGALDVHGRKAPVPSVASSTRAAAETFDYGISNFDRGWEFALRDFWFSFCKVGLGPGGNNNGIPDVLATNAAWRAVTIPHDWMLGCAVSQSGRNGFRAVGPNFPGNSIGWYRKTFSLPARFEGGRVYLQFDGIYRDAMVWVNGVYLGRNDSGYIGRRFDVTDVLNYGEKPDSVVVRVDATRTSGWWYDGAGIYRHVKLIVKRADHLEPDSVFFRTVSVKDGKATVAASARKVGRGQIVFALDGQTFTDQLTLKAPRLWSPDAPNLYRFAARLVADDGAILDEESFDVGIRMVRFDAAHGLFVNDRPVKVHGVCCHQDFGCVGVAVPDAIQDYRVRRLKAMGVNADRTCHNPPTPEFLDACDRHGIMVMDEQRFFSASDEGLDQLRRLVLRDRNHPSVITWSLGNEEHNVQNGALGRRMAKRMYALAKELDPTRAITYGGNNGAGWTGVNEVVDVRGVNYVRIGSKNISGPNAFECQDGYHAAHPAQPVWGSEESSAFATRGCRAAAPGVYPDGDSRAENVAFPWVATAEECWNWAAAREWFAGPFIWTGFDYRGESRWPALINNFGAMDLCGFPKAKFWYYRANWTEEDVLHVSPHWNAPTTNLVVDTNCDEVELFVNGKSVGRRKGDRLHHLNFPVTWAPGEVVAKGRRGGRDVEFRMATSGPVTKLAAVADRTTLVADGADATVVNFTALDAAGREVPDANDLVVFEVEGKGEIVGVGNGDPLSHEDEVMSAPWKRKLFNGLCQVVVRSAARPGTLTIRARLGESVVTTTIKCEEAAREHKPFSAASAATPDWRPARTWKGFNLLGMFRAPTIGLAPDPRVDGHFVEWEFKALHDWGFNFARLPLDYRILIEGDDWNRLDERKMRCLDEAIAWGRKYGVHVQIALHRIPGYCILDQTEAFPLGTSPVAQAAAARMWAAFARRWKDVPNEELSFNLYNEPTRHADGDNGEKLAHLLIGAIRAEDPKRFIMADGLGCAGRPIPSLYQIPAVGQAFRGYTPHALTHYLSGYAGGNAKEPPTWPLKEGYAEKWNSTSPEATVAKYQEALDAGECCMVGEFGCRNRTPHAVTLAWMEHCLKLWQSKDLGWALWNLRGHNGVLDSGREDVVYEDFLGHKLDRAMLDLLRKYAR